MKRLAALALMFAARGPASADVLHHEPSDHAPADLSGNDGGTGWSGAWTDAGNPAVVSAAGLAYSDAAGRIPAVSGGSADSADGGGATTISLRDFGGGLNDVWISFLYQLPSSNNKFEGIPFHPGTQQVFSIGNPSTTASAAVFLTNNPVANAGVNSGKGVFCNTHFVVLKPTKGGGTGGIDRIVALIAALRANPDWFSLHASAEITDVSIDGLNMHQFVPGTIDYSSALRDRFGVPTEFIDRSLDTPPHKRFLRPKIKSP